MLSLPKIIKKRGFTYNLVTRQGDVALYEQMLEDTLVGYEVILVQKNTQERILGGVIYPPSEYYPSDNSWGVKGFSFYTLPKAQAKFKEIVENRPTVTKI